MMGQTDGRPDMRTIGEWQGMMRELFRRAYGGYACQKPPGSMKCFIEDLRARYNYFYIGDRCLLGDPDDDWCPVFADCLTFLFVVCDRLSIDLARAIAIKWPGACFYCGKVKDCGCVGRHGAPMLDGSGRMDLVIKPLRDWQAMLGGVFGATNRVQGIEKVCAHLGKEIIEFAEAVEAFEASRSDTDELAAMLEAADVLAWSIAVANLINIDLSFALSLVYRLDRCPSCEGEVCEDEANCPLSGWSRSS